MDRPAITIHFRVVEQREVRAALLENPLRAEFWASVINEHPISFISDVSLCEDRILRTFGAHLADFIRPHHVEQPPGPYRFMPLSIVYGSLDIKLGIDGAENLLAAFGGSAQTLIDILSQYAPQAFVASIPVPALLNRPVRADIVDSDWLKELDSPDETDKSGRRNLPSENFPQRLTSQPENQEQQSLASSIAATKGLVTSYVQQKSARGLWLLANTSFILPVALSLATVFIAFRAVEVERDRVERRSQELDKRDAALREAILAREARMFELIVNQRTLRASSEGASGKETKGDLKR